MTNEQRLNLERQLWNIANDLRGKMDADEFRDYVLGFIFYKYLSDKQYRHANEILKNEPITDYVHITDDDDLEAIKDDSIESIGYFLKPSQLFSVIAKKGNEKQKNKDGDKNNADAKQKFILEDLEHIFTYIEQSTLGNDSEDDFVHLFEDIDLNSTKLGRSVDARNELVAKILAHLDAIDFSLEDSEADILGDAYEYLIGEFAAGAGKKAGEFYTPQQVSRILAKIVTMDKKKIKNAYDPTCGSGSLLLRIGREADVGHFYGQELNRTTFNLARMNMLLHDVHYSQFDIRQEDTLEHPQHIDMEFEAIVANPPFSAKWKGDNNPLNANDERFSQYGKIAPSSKADYAFIQHMIAHLADNGTMAVVVPHGVLFRGASEGAIRQYLIKKLNYLDAVIGLPANLFYGTSIPACIMVFKKCRKHDDIFFIDASSEFQKQGNQNILTNDHVNKIINAYAERAEIAKYAYPASLNEIKENDYNLNISRYVDTFEEEETINIDAVCAKLKEIDNDMVAVDKTIKDFCDELKIPTPF